MKSSKTLYVGTGLLGALVFAAIFAPLITNFDPNEQDLMNTLLGSTSQHWLGTDPLGRDVLTRLIYGARVDLAIGLLAVVLPYIIGVSLGLLTGWRGGKTDSVIMRVVDTVIAFPFYVLAIALVFIFGPGIKSIIIAITLVGWVAYCRIVRANVLVAKEQDYIHAARLTGLPTSRILRRHMLPNVISQSIVFAMSDIVLSILAIVSLGYLGLGVPVPTAEWGSMIQEGQGYITEQWWLATVPGLMVVYVGFSLSLIGDGLVARLER